MGLKKHELMENYTMEQLADMVIEMQDKKDCENKSYKIPFAKMHDEELEKFLSESPLKKSMDNLFEDIKKQKDNAIAKAFTEQIGNLLRDNGVIAHYITNEAIYETEENPVALKYGVLFDSLDFSEHDKRFTDEIKDLNRQLDRKQTEINQIDEILNELFGVTHDIAKPNEFKEILKDKLKGNVGSDGYSEKQKKTNNFYGIYASSSKDLTKDDILVFLGILTKELVENGIDFRYSMENEMKVYDITKKDNKSIADFLPREPIDVASLLINVEHIWFDISELRQIAEHLLVYCNGQKENGDE